MNPRVLVLALALAGCAAPQSGWQRPAYIGANAIDGMMIGVALGGTGCAAASTSTCTWPMLAGALAGGVAAGAGSAASDRAPGTLEATAVVALPIVVVIGGLYLLGRAFSKPMT